MDNPPPFPYPDPDPYIVDGLVWVSNAEAETESANQLAARQGLSVGPPRPTIFEPLAAWGFPGGSLEELQIAGIIGLYGPPLRAAAPPRPATPNSAPTPPPAGKPAKKRMSTPRPAAGQDSLF